MNKLYEEVGKEIMENLVNFEGSDICDIDYEMYGKDYYIGEEKAKEFIKDNLDEVLEMMHDFNFIDGRLENPGDYQHIATLAAQHQARLFILDNEILLENWDNELTKEIIDEVLKGETNNE